MKLTKNLSSNRKINKGYFSTLIELANKIHGVKEDLITNYLTKEWNSFYEDKMSYWSNLFNRKLCYEEKSASGLFNNYGNNYDSTDNKNSSINTTEKENNENNENEEEDNKNENVKILLFY